MSEHLVPQLANEYNAAVLILLAVIGGFVALMSKAAAGMLCPAPRKHAYSKEPNPISALSAGIVIFFSDLGTPLIVVRHLEPHSIRIGLSRQKLAYIIDATAAPVAILVPFTGITFQ